PYRTGPPDPGGRCRGPGGGRGPRIGTAYALVSLLLRRGEDDSGVDTPPPDSRRGGSVALPGGGLGRHGPALGRTYTRTLLLGVRALGRRPELTGGVRALGKAP